MIFKREHFAGLLGPNLTRQVFQNGTKEISDSDLYELFAEREVDGSIIAEMLIQVAGYSDPYNVSAVCNTFMSFYDISSLQEICHLLDEPSRCPDPIPTKIKRSYNALRKALSNKEDYGILGWAFADLMYEFEAYQNVLMKKLIKKLVQAYKQLDK